MDASRRSEVRGSISAVIPCYNHARYIERAIRSAMTQTRPVDEVIVVDDGSTDQSSVIIRRLGVRCIRSERRSGPSAARNLGVAAARGDLIAFLDADDYWEPTHCEHVAALLERHAECAVAFSRARLFTHDDASPTLDIVSENDSARWATAIVIPEDQPTSMQRHLLQSNLVPQSTAIVRRSILEQRGGYDASRLLAEDYELWLRLSRSHPFVCTHRITAGYRQHRAQLTRDVEGMARADFQVKHQFWRDAASRESPDVVHRLAAVILDAWNAELARAWNSGNERVVRAVLDTHDLVPGSAPSHRRWKRRFRLWWPGWVVLSRVWARLPRSTKKLARPLVSAVMRPPSTRAT
jgi:GT2 family glycosyltransferase